MRKSALVLAATLAACFTLTDAQAAKKAKPPADPAYEWNVKNVKWTAPNWGAPFQQPAEPAKKSKKKSKKS